jgi:hypothetical protein
MSYVKMEAASRHSLFRVCFASLRKPDFRLILSCQTEIGGAMMSEHKPMQAVVKNQFGGRGKLMIGLQLRRASQ